MGQRMMSRGKLNGLDLFSGIGGITIALNEWVRPVAYCESDRYCQGVLLSRMQSGDISTAPIWDDVATLKGNMLPEIDIIYGGFPCQDISVAGAGVGMERGSRSGLFFEIERLVRETNPKFVFLENVPAIRTRGLNAVAQAFTELRYDFRWTILSAAEVGACHLRKRWFMLAHSNSTTVRPQPRRVRRAQWKEKTFTRVDGKSRPFAYANGTGLEGTGRGESRITRPAIYNGWKTKPTLHRGDNGLPFRMDRIRGLGNSVVPLQAKVAFERLMGKFREVK